MTIPPKADGTRSDAGRSKPAVVLRVIGAAGATTAVDRAGRAFCSALARQACVQAHQTLA